MVLQPPLFPSDCEFAQLLTIFQILGTPTEQTWPGVTQLKDWYALFSMYYGSMHASGLFDSVLFTGTHIHSGQLLTCMLTWARLLTSKAWIYC